VNIRELLQFKSWAENIYLDYITKLSEDQFTERIPTIDKSIKQIIFHLLDSMWGDYHLITDRDWSEPYQIDDMSKMAIIKEIKKFNTQLLTFAERQQLDEPITYHEEGYENDITTTAEQVLCNFVEHSAYHRGQLALCLKYFGHNQIKQTNYNPYLWQRQQ